MQKSSETSSLEDAADINLALPRSLPMALLRAREAVMRHFRASLRAHQITEQQWRVIRAISSAGEIEVSDLAKNTYLLGPSLSRILKTLEKNGYIERRTSKEDQRRSVLSLAPLGVGLIAAHMPESTRIYEQVAQAYGHEKLELLQAMLKDFERAMNSFNIIEDDEDYYEE